jgi:hypothetical protein
MKTQGDAVLVQVVGVGGVAFVLEQAATNTNEESESTRERRCIGAL